MMSKRYQTGFTLIELLLYVAIVGTLLIAVSSFFALSTEARVKNQSISEVNQQGVAAMAMITQAIRGSTAITAPATGASGSALTVTMPTPAVSPTIFNVSNGVLQITEGSGSAVALTNNKVQVTAFTVKNLTRGSAAHVQVILTLSRINNSNRNEYDYQKTFTSSAESQW